ncbi:hemin transporter [Actinoplanes sp. TBRC 11911]|uniref:globin domain-containing protein n=1 Tax=Actinoplanes sp. TBRC 11911 TaxID=2729386 RepID=UPI00145C4494|nr:globin domain-containing protein [Actinoplanes sp. TBRC 11911]NMO49601.1 hemin transporter [Actinoplanes sp. TBRC 11911]
MLSETSSAVVRATLPAVGEHLDAIAGRFYETMLGENPDLLNLFSRSAQATGEQRRALAGAIAAFGAHLIGEGPSFDAIAARIAHRHAALGIRPEQYTVVGKYLMRAISEVLGDAVTPDVGAAWDEVYWLFATRLVGLEARLYAAAGVDDASPWRSFTVAQRREEAEDAVSFILTPADGGPAPQFRPGQYVTVAADLPDGRQLRQYSLSQAPAAGALRITVRLVPGGAVSTHLHRTVAAGDTLSLSAPYGNSLLLSPGLTPLVLISAGVGITPMASILDHVARTQPTRDVTVVHADRSPARHALHDDIALAGARLRSFHEMLWYEEPRDATDIHSGLIDPYRIPLTGDSDIYVCGPLPFMQAVRRDLLDRGVAPERIRYEIFGADVFESPRPVAA